MFRLRDLKNGLYQIHSSMHRDGYEGVPRSIFPAATHMGVQTNALLVAVRELQATGKDYADFNQNGQLIELGKDPKRGYDS